VYVERHIIWRTTVLSKIYSNLSGNVFTATGRRASVSRQSRSIRRRLRAAGEEGKEGDEREAIRATASTCKNGDGKSDGVQTRERQPIKSATCPVTFTSFRPSSYIPSEFFFLPFAIRSLLISSISFGFPFESPDQELVRQAGHAWWLNS